MKSHAKDLLCLVVPKITSVLFFWQKNDSILHKLHIKVKLNSLMTSLVLDLRREGLVNFKSK